MRMKKEIVILHWKRGYKIVESNKMSIAIDLKKYRIRIHKSTLRGLGEPNIVQLLFNPDRRALLISCPTKSISESQDEKVLFDKPGTDGTYQLYSRSLLKRMQEICTGLEDNCLYHVNGKYIKNMNAAFFSMDTSIKVEESEETTDE